VPDADEPCDGEIDGDAYGAGPCRSEPGSAGASYRCVVPPVSSPGIRRVSSLSLSLGFLLPSFGLCSVMPTSMAAQA